MSSGLTFPVLAGRGWSLTKTPIWSTKVQTAVNGKELRATYFSRPRWKFTLTHEVLRADSVNAELQSLLGFFHLMKGSFDDFYFIDPNDYTATDVNFGTGTGSATSFELLRPIGSWTDNVLADATPVIKVSGSPVTPASITYGVNNTTIVFSSPPAGAAPLTWTGTYKFRCRFLHDEADFENFMRQLWMQKKIDFISIK